MKEADPAQVANRLRGRCGFQVQRPGLQPRPYFLLRRPRRPSSRTVRARLRILNLISYESRNVTINVPTAARAARASKTFDISDTSKGKHRPRAGIRRCDSTPLAAAGDLSCAKDVPCGASPQSSQRSRLLRVIGGGTSSLPARLRRDGGVKPLQTTPTYRYRISDSQGGRGRSTSPPPCGHLSFVICHIIFRT